MNENEYYIEDEYERRCIHRFDWYALAGSFICSICGAVMFINGTYASSSNITLHYRQIDGKLVQVMV